MGSGEDTGGGDVLGRSWLPSGLTSGPLLCTGESGLGKSTLINSLFLTNLYEDRQVPDASGKSTPLLHPCMLPNPTAVPVFLLWWSWPLPVSSGRILFLSIWGLWWPLGFFLSLFPLLKTHGGSCGTRKRALLQSPMHQLLCPFSSHRTNSDH